MTSPPSELVWWYHTLHRPHVVSRCGLARYVVIYFGKGPCTRTAYVFVIATAVISARNLDTTAFPCWAIRWNINSRHAAAT